MKFLKALVVLAFLLLIFCQNELFAQHSANYSSIKPGLSLKREIDDFLGKPIDTILPDARYRYNSDHYAIKYIDVIYTRDTSRVDYFVLYLSPGTYQADAKQLFNLEEPIKRRYNHEGGLVEVFFPQGIFMHYSGTGNNSTVDKVEVVSSLFFELLAEQKYNDYLDDYVYGLGVTIENNAFKGLKVMDLKEGSAADLAGIKVGDIILEIEDFVFNSQLNLTRFKKTVKYLPINQKLRIRVEREKSEIDYYVALDELTDLEKIIISIHDIRQGQKNLMNQLLPVKRSLYGIEDLLETIKTVEGELPPGVKLDDDAFLVDLGIKYDSDLIISESLPGLVFKKDENALKGVPFLDFSTIRFYDTKLLLSLSIAFIKIEKYTYAIEILSKLLEYDKRNSKTMYLMAYCYDKTEQNEMARLYYGNVSQVRETPDVIKAFALERYNLLKK